MIFYPTGKQAQIIDKYTQEVIGLPGLVLMEKAAEALADEIINKIECCKIAGQNKDICDNAGQKKEYCCETDKLYGFRKDRDKILAIVEGGNNGGDAAAAARILKTKGYDTYIYEINGISRQTDSYMKQIQIAAASGVKFVKEPLNEEDLSGYRIILDGIFGVGLSREVKGIQSAVIDMINSAGERGCYVVGTDIPSGVSADTGKILGNAVRCDLTVTFHYTKYGMLLNKGREYSGEISCKDIGLFTVNTASDMKRVLDIEDLSDQKIIYEYDDEDIAIRIPKRNASSNKGSYGKVLILAGSKEVYGALYLSAAAALKIGAGLVKVVTDIRNKEVLSEKLPEAMCLAYDSEADITPDFIKEYDKAIAWADVILAGPGLGTGEVSETLLNNAIEKIASGQQLIMDADALNIISRKDVGEILAPLTRKLGFENVVITPHIMEMSRLRGSLKDKTSFDEEIKKAGYESKIDYIKDSAFDVAKLFSDEYGCICILKDARTAVSCTGYLSDKKEMLCYINTTGNSGMSTAGSGDVLSGILAGVLAQNSEEQMTVYEASCLAVNLHGRAGDCAKTHKGEHSLLAGDIIECIPHVFSDCMS
ncbi:NAD(P)H-hydrate epimerase [Lachnospiraceae bacterium]|nr:NAD(P)H-hydrate epimerase [Lachnospiraceae bacterium]